MENKKERVKAPHHATTEYKELKAKGLIDADGYIVDEAIKIEVNNPLIINENQNKEEVNVEKTFTESQVNDILSKLKKEIKEEFMQPQAQQNQGGQIIQQIITQKVNIDDDIPEFKNWEYKDREYRVCGGKKPVSRGIATTHTAISPLQYLHKEKKIMYGLRYSTTQQSFFIENQTTGLGDIRQEEITLEFGTLRVPATMVNLQKYLTIHPHNQANGGSVFYEYDADAEANIAIDKKQSKKNAYALIDKAGKETNRAIASLKVVNYIQDWTDKQVENAIYDFVETDAKTYIELVNDPSITIKGIVKSAMAKGYLVWKNYRFYDKNSTLILEVPKNANEIDEMAKHLQSGEGRTLLDFFRNID